MHVADACFSAGRSAWNWSEPSALRIAASIASATTGASRSRNPWRWSAWRSSFARFCSTSRPRLARARSVLDGTRSRRRLRMCPVTRDPQKFLTPRCGDRSGSRAVVWAGTRHGSSATRCPTNGQQASNLVAGDPGRPAQEHRREKADQRDPVVGRKKTGVKSFTPLDLPPAILPKKSARLRVPCALFSCSRPTHDRRRQPTLF